MYHRFNDVLKIKKYLDAIVDTKFGTGSLFILAGIQINMPEPMPDYFQPLIFERYSLGKQKMDLFQSTFGQPPSPAKEFQPLRNLGSQAEPEKVSRCCTGWL